MTRSSWKATSPMIMVSGPAINDDDKDLDDDFDPYDPLEEPLRFEFAKVSGTCVSAINVEIKV